MAPKAIYNFMDVPHEFPGMFRSFTCSKKGIRKPEVGILPTDDPATSGGIIRQQLAFRKK